MVRRTVFLGVVALMVAPGWAGAIPTDEGDFVHVVMRHTHGIIGPQRGMMMVVPPQGHHVLVADDGAGCHILGGEPGCHTRLEVPAGIEASGVWSVAYVPQRPHNPIHPVCLFGIPDMVPVWGGTCIVPGWWPDEPYLQYDLAFDLAGWQGGTSVRCVTLTGAVWTLDHDERTVTTTCARYGLGEYL